MANNKISVGLEMLGEVGKHDAAKLDRLVEAAKAIQEDAREHDTLHPNHVTVGRMLIEQLEAALRDIEVLNNG